MERLSRLRPRLLSKPVSPRPKSVRGPHFCRRELDQPFPRQPLMLLEQHTAKLCQRVRSGIIECPEDALTVLMVSATTSAPRGPASCGARRGVRCGQAELVRCRAREWQVELEPGHVDPGVTSRAPAAGHLRDEREA